TGTVTPSTMPMMASTTSVSMRVKATSDGVLVDDIFILSRAAFRFVGAVGNKIVIAAFSRDAVDVGGTPRIGQRGLLVEVWSLPALGRRGLLDEGIESLFLGRIAAHVDAVEIERFADILDFKSGGFSLGAVEMLEHLRRGDHGEQADDGQHHHELDEG